MPTAEQKKEIEIVRYEKKFKGGFVCEMTCSPALKSVRMTWSPEMPPPRVLRRILPEYRRWRNDCLRRYSRRIGGKIMVADVGADDSISAQIIHELH